MITLDMKGNKYFNEDQIDKLLQTAIRQRVSQEDEFKAARLTRGTPTADQQAFIDKIDTHIQSCVSDAAKLRADSELIHSAIRYERAVRRLNEVDLSIGRAEVVGGYTETSDSVLVGSVIRNMRKTKTIEHGIVLDIRGDVLDYAIIPSDAPLSDAPDVADVIDFPVSRAVVCTWIRPQSAIEPLPAKIIVDDVEMDNPLYVRDQEERAAAQAIIDSAPQATLDLVALRGNV